MDNEYCLGTTWSYFAGKGFDIDDSTNLTIEYNWVHHCTDSGIRCDRCDDVLIRYNLVYGNVWYTHSASSGIVFAESQGTGNLTFEGNVVYANRNYLPFFLTQGLDHFGAGVENYGLWNMASVVDGSGVYITRNLDYEGTFTLKDNIAFDNGINGLVVHKTTHENVNIVVENNRIFDNGRTWSTWEGRQAAGGMTINSGDYTSTQQVKDNTVSCGDDPDVSYQCFGTCVLEADSTNNAWCGGDPNTSKLTSTDGQDVFVQNDCTQQEADNLAYRALFPHSHMIYCPQWTPFLEADGYDCTEPELPETLPDGENPMDYFDDGICDDDEWTIVDVIPPPDECCTTDWTDDATCDVLQNAVDAAGPCTILALSSERIYCTKKWYKQGASEPWDFRHQALVKIIDSHDGL